MRIRRQMFGPGNTRARGRFTFGPPDALRLAAAALVLALCAAPPAAAADPAAGAEPRPYQPAANNPPQVTEFQVTWVLGNLWLVSGKVIDENPAGLTVSFGGEPESFQNLTTKTDANGNFSFTIQLNTNGTDNGLASAQTVDGKGLKSNVAMYMVISSN
jgi:hypothetical protein